MDSDSPSLLKRLLAVAVLVVVAIVALRLIFGFIAGLVTALLWVLVVVALVVALLWARSTLKSGKRGRSVKPGAGHDLAAPGEDPVAVEMRRITEQLREQGRR